MKSPKLASDPVGLVELREVPRALELDEARRRHEVEYVRDRGRPE